MRNGLIIAIVAEIVVLVAAFAFSVAIIFFGVGRDNMVLNMVIVFLWVLVAGVLLFVFWWRSLVREEMMRRFFISDEWVYNHEIGYAPMKRVAPNGDAYAFAAFAADALANMSYGFEVADAPEEFNPKFVIASRIFRYHYSGGEDGDEDMGEKPDGIVVDQWRGALQTVQAGAQGEQSYSDIGKFADARELAGLLEDNGVFERMQLSPSAEEGE